MSEQSSTEKAPTPPCAACGTPGVQCDRLWASGSPASCCSGCLASGGCTHTPARPDGPILPHGTQPTERQWQIAEALDDLVMSQGVVLDDGTLDWLVDWVDRLVARRLAEHRGEWASYIEHWGGSVGPEPPTPERIVAALRLPEPPFGVEASA